MHGNNKAYMTRRFSYPLKALSVALLATAAVGCEDIDNEQLQGNWYNTYSYFPGTPRGGAVCFQLVYKDTLRAFVGTGANTNKTEDMERYRDFYMCTLRGDGMPSWSARYAKLANKSESATEGTIDGTNSEGIETLNAVCSMPNTFTVDTTGSKVYTCPARNGGVAFSLTVGDKPYGFVGLGYDGTNYLNDLWRYDPEANNWTRVADYPGDKIRYASAFVLGNKAYVGGGEDYDNNILADFYSYDPESNTWSGIATCNVPRAQASTFVCNGEAYLCGGYNGSKIDVLEKYNAQTNTWTRMRRLSDATRESFDDQYTGLAMYGSTAFTLNDNTADCRAYIVTGGSTGTSKNCWEYNPFYDYWVQKSSFEGDARKFAVSFVLRYDVDGKGEQDVALVTTGSTSDMNVTGSGGTFFADTWLWQPQAPYEHRD